MSTLNCPEEVLLAERLVELHPWSDMVRLARTGGEANAIAVRIARAASGRDKVAVCGYHGWHDWYLAANLRGVENLETHLLPGLQPAGVPKCLHGTVIPFRYNCFDQLESLVKENADIGVIKMEVARSEKTTNEFLQNVRSLATDSGIVLIFDECTTGFRQTYGGLHKEYGVDPDFIVSTGGSAGGHLASTLSTHYNDQVYTSNYTVSARPDFSILVYPVISMDENITHMGSRTNLLGENANAEDLQKYSNEKQVNKQTPPTFLIHTTVDKAVPVENSINYYLALKNNEVDAEMHLYEKGRHGMGLGLEGTNQYWPDDLEHWLRAHEYIAEKETYLFSYFKGNGEDGLHFAQSDDGLKWKTLKNDQSFLTPLDLFQFLVL